MGTIRSVSEAGPTSNAPVRKLSRVTAGRWVERALWLVVVAFGAAIAVGIVGTLWELIQLSHPAPDFGYLVFDDALQMYSGHWPWQDPATGYVGLIYPPVFSGLFAALLHIHMWSGWGVLLSILSSLVLAAIVAGTAYRRVGTPSATPARVLEAAAVGLVGWWLVTFTPLSGLDGRTDTTAWALALGGLLLVPRALAGSRGGMCAAIALLTLGFWTKQQAQGAMIVAVVWAAVACIAGVAPWRRAAVLAASLAMVNLAILGLLYLTSDGWVYYYLFQMARDHYWGFAPLHKFLVAAWQIGWLPLVFMVVMLGAAGWAGADRRPGWRRRALAENHDVQQLVLLLLFVITVTPVAIYSERHQGSADNQLIGPLWGVALLSALGWRVSGRRRGSRIVTGLAVAGLASLGLAFGHAGTGEIQQLAGMNRIRDIVTVTRFDQLSETLRTVARGHTLYDWHHSDLGMRGGHVPSSATVCDLVAAGLSPIALEHAIATRRYDLMTLAPFSEQPACSGFGKWEASYFWKLNALINVGYQPNPSRYPDGVLERRAGAAPIAALRKLERCFAPYRLGGVLFRIGFGGGFWCQSTPTDPRLTLGDIPNSASAVLSDGIVTSATGSIVITLPPGAGTAAVVVATGQQRFDAVGKLASAPGSEGRAVVTFGARRGAAANAAVRDGIAEQSVDPARFDGNRLALLATANSGAQFDFSGMTLKTKGGVARGAVTRRGLP
jgi:hypothetical protein